MQYWLKVGRVERADEAGLVEDLQIWRISRFEEEQIEQKVQGGLQAFQQLQDELLLILQTTECLGEPDVLCMRQQHSQIILAWVQLCSLLEQRLVKE